MPLEVVDGLVGGAEAGELVGVLVGAAVGDGTGASVGELNGASVGDAEGALVGDFTGDPVEEGTGAAVGEATGADVGDKETVESEHWLPTETGQSPPKQLEIIATVLSVNVTSKETFPWVPLRPAAHVAPEFLYIVTRLPSRMISTPDTPVVPPATRIFV